MTRATSIQFRSHLGQYQDQAEKEPVEITRRGRPSLVLMSADHYQWLMAAARRTHLTAEAADVVAEAVGQAEMPAELAYLDELLK
jgi:prevent-host-death family protein